MKIHKSVILPRALRCLTLVLAVTLCLFAIPKTNASAVAPNASSSEEQFFQVVFRDIEDNRTKKPNAYAKIFLERGHSYEVRIIFDLPDSIDLATNRLSIFIPTKKTGGIHQEPMYIIVESLNGEELIRSRKYLCSQWFTYMINITSQPTFYNKSYPDGIRIDEKLFSDGAILNDIESTQKGYISFYVELVKPHLNSPIAAWFNNPAATVGTIGGVIAGIYYGKAKERRKKNSGANPNT